MEKRFILAGAVLMFLGVAAGALGAHGLANYFTQYPDLEGTFETAVRYHIYHALALFIVVWLIDKWPGHWTRWSGTVVCVGYYLVFW